MQNINLNDSVAVKLTPAGVEQLNKFWDNQFTVALNGTLPEYREEAKKKSAAFYETQKAIPADGWKEFSFLELMQIFGPWVSFQYKDPVTYPFADSEIRYIGDTTRVADEMMDKPAVRYYQPPYRVPGGRRPHPGGDH